jgi:hypothetical protein
VPPHVVQGIPTMTLKAWGTWSALEGHASIEEREGTDRSTCWYNPKTIPPYERMPNTD